MFKTIAALLAAAAFSFTAAPAIADTSIDPPASNAYATQDPVAFNAQGPSMPCRTHRSVDCYWDVIGHTHQWGESYFVIRVGREVCIKFWNRKYDRNHGHCESIRAFHHHH